MDLAVLWLVGSSFPTRDRTHVPCVARQMLDHWTAGEVPTESCSTVTWSSVTVMLSGSACHGRCRLNVFVALWLFPVFLENETNPVSLLKMAAD